jgi:nucleotide-binding universal stress UspA family protein
MFTKILVALDGSEPSKRALNVAVDLAEKYSANILLLSVVQRVSHVRADLDHEYKETLKARHKKLLMKSKKKIEENKPSLRVSTKLLEGRPAKKIIEMVKKDYFDLIVMGSRGLGGVSRHLLGSVSDRVTNEADCPILIVR